MDTETAKLLNEIDERLKKVEEWIKEEDKARESFLKVLRIGRERAIKEGLRIDDL